MKNKRRRVRIGSAFHVGNILKHLVRSLNRLGINLVRSLRHDQVHHLLDEIHVGGFGVSLDGSAKALLARFSNLGRTARGRLFVEIPAETAETRGIAESRKCEGERLRARGSL